MEDYHAQIGAALAEMQRLLDAPELESERQGDESPEFFVMRKALEASGLLVRPKPLSSWMDHVDTAAQVCAEMAAAAEAAEDYDAAEKLTATVAILDQHGRR